MLYTKIDEFLSMDQGKTATKTAPPVKPTTPTRETPQRPSPIRRDKPGADPHPKAIAKDVVARFMTELRKNKIPLEFDLPKLKTKHND